MIDEKVDRLLARLKRHERPLSFVLALSGKTIRAIEIACVSDIETERLDNIFMFPAILIRAFIMIELCVCCRTLPLRRRESWTRKKSRGVIRTREQLLLIDELLHFNER